MAQREIISHRNQVDKWSLGGVGEFLTIHPGRNLVDADEVKQAMSLTDAFADRVRSGEYEARKLQVAVKPRPEG